MSDKVYYDESCHVCSLEINAIRKKGEACGIEFVDISDTEFEHGDSDYDSEMIGEFDGEKTIGNVHCHLSGSALAGSPEKNLG